ncbi:MAG TPA: peptidylprolyl isomerase [Burkholderiales bacterium]|nr:peptidylprolyl isomerase [Burkholderiales bacterium]
MLKRWLREPLVHFLALGALLFLVFHVWGSSPQRIVITPGQVQSLTAGFQRVWQRPPTEAELKHLVGEQVRAEIAAREAAALGLDRDDIVVQRRLRQKLEFLAEETVDAAPPTDAELQAYLAAHAEQFREEPETAFRQAYFKSLDAARAALAAGGDPVARSDRIMLPEDVALAPRSDIARRFGREFAERLEALPTDRWAGPVRSGYGAHLVLVRERKAGRLPALAEIRPRVEREVLAQRRQQALDALYARLLEKYEVVIQ